MNPLQIAYLACKSVIAVAAEVKNIASEKDNAYWDIRIKEAEERDRQEEKKRLKAEEHNRQFNRKWKDFFSSTTVRIAPLVILAVVISMVIISSSLRYKVPVGRGIGIVIVVYACLIIRRIFKCL